MKLKSFGCSFIYGSDLSDCQHATGVDHPLASQKTWPALLAKTRNMDYECHAWPGIGNQAIAEKVLAQIASGEDSVYVISWSWIDRFDYIDQTEARWRPPGWQALRPGESGIVHEVYFKHLHHQYSDKFKSLMMINCVIDALERHGMRYLMTYMDDLIFEKIWHTNAAIDFLQTRLPSIMSDFDGKTFLEWSRERSYPISPKNHPLDQAHSSAAEYVRTHWDSFCSTKDKYREGA